MVTKKQAVLRVSGVAAAMAVAVSPILASAVTDTTTITATVNETISMNTSDNVAMTLTPGSQPVTSIASDAVSVSTNKTTGYTLSLADSDSDTALKSGPINAINAHTGTHAAPTALTDNTWGYAVASTGGFDSSYSNVTNSTTSTATFAGVPASGGPGQAIKVTSMEATSDLTTVYYGARVNSTLPTGSYVDTVTYTAVTNP